MSKQSFSRTAWRLIVTKPADGATNMAVDQAIAEAVVAGDELPTLRFYSWRPACVSLGQSQSADLLDLNRCAALGWHIVRRTTGGRTVLHANELTYSIAAPQDEPRVKGGVLASYQQLSLGLQAGLAMAGLLPKRSADGNSTSSSDDPACFNVASAYELLVNGKKLIGSAQMRSRGLVLQHGSIPLAGDIGRLADGLDLPERDREQLRQRLSQQATTVAAAAGQVINSAEMIRHLTNGFASALNLDFVPSQLTTAEQARAAQIRAEKFANIAWTYRK